jgi:hypothetical protein
MAAVISGVSKILSFNLLIDRQGTFITPALENIAGPAIWYEGCPGEGVLRAGGRGVDAGRPRQSLQLPILIQASAKKKPPDLLYAERLHRYVTAMRNGMPDRVPLRPFAAEITARYAGYTCQEVTHDYRKAFDAVIRCCSDFEWDAVVPNMVYVWTGQTQAIGLRYRRGFPISRTLRAGGLHAGDRRRSADCRAHLERCRGAGVPLHLARPA